MNVLILANKFNTYSTRRLVEAFEARGHTARLLSPFNTTLLINPETIVQEKEPVFAVGGRRSAVIFSGGKPLPLPDVALLRIAAHTEFGATLGRAAEYHLATHLKLKGARCINDPEAKRQAGNKFLSLQILSQAGLPAPPTALTWDAENIEWLARDYLGAPLALKANDRTWGEGVELAEDVEAAYAILKRARETYRVMLAQQYIREARGQDIRVFVVGEEIVGAMRRIAPPGDFRANVHLGGRAENIAELPAEYARLAVSAVKILKLDIAGVDLLESKKGPLVLEVNSSPGLEMIEAVTKGDIAGRIVAYLEGK